jgi:hypothetical protein
VVTPNVNQNRRIHMKRILMSAALSMLLGVGLAAPAAVASQGKNSNKTAPKMSAHAEAVKKCNEDYKAAVKKANDDHAAAVKDAKGKKGKERTDAMAAANKSRTDALAAARQAKADCVKAAPKK